VSGFSTEWLALREPLDLRARSKDVLDAVAAAFRGSNSLSVVDLGSGTGSTVRALSPRLPRPQSWRLVDNDPVLLAEAFAMERPHEVAVETVQFDLNDDIGALFDDGAELVASSALIDLVSEPWLANFAAATAARRLPVYIALTYDGRTTFGDADPLDAQVIAAVNMHQLGNKGFGPALGPRAAEFAMRMFRTFGYEVTYGQSDWVADGANVAFQLELLTGWRQAAEETDEIARDSLTDWYARRSEAAKAGRLALTVGHVDFFAQPRSR
jgi:hypothetical protein